jgi:16S rRNA (guanine966-N2)-methyltransferase
VRVVAGAFKGRRLHVPPGRGTRPTADRVREALFSMLAGVEGASVLDLYAGSGALGIEALSRGARDAVFVERDPRAAETIERNLALAGVRAAVRREDVLAFLGRPTEAAYHLVFCDPPYDLGPRIAGRLAESLPALLSEDARIVTESDKRHPIELPLPLLVERTYGDTRVAIHGR